MCMVDYSDRPCEVLTSAERKARKEHKCYECNRPIVKGETYLYESYVFDGEMFKSKTCAHCQVVRNWLSAECGGFLYQGVREDIHEHVLESPDHYGKGVIMLSVGISRRWMKKDGTMWRVPSMPKTTLQKAAAFS